MNYDNFSFKIKDENGDEFINDIICVVPNDKIPEKNEKIINDKTSTKKSNRIPTKITIDPIKIQDYLNIIVH